MRRDDAYLLDMLTAAREAISLTSGLTREQFLASRLHQLAVIKLIETIGEAASRVPTAISAAHPEIPWSGIVGMRNRPVHGYFEVPEVMQAQQIIAGQGQVTERGDHQSQAKPPDGQLPQIGDDVLIVKFRQGTMQHPQGGDEQTDADQRAETSQSDVLHTPPNPPATAINALTSRLLRLSQRGQGRDSAGHALSPPLQGLTASVCAVAVIRPRVTAA